MYDIIVVGGGPAGLTAAIYALRAGKTVLVIEKGGFGGQIAFSPKVENIPGFSVIGGSEFAEKLTDQALSLGADAEIETVTAVNTAGDVFTVPTEEGGSYQSHAVILNGLKNPFPAMTGWYKTIPPSRRCRARFRLRCPKVATACSACNF